MDRSLLTPEDREWLAKLADANCKGFDFILYNLKKSDTRCDQRHAGAVPIWYQQNFVLAEKVLRTIEKQVPYSQIFEQWESRVYTEVVRACAKLSKFDARVLFMTAGFHRTTERAIFDAAGEAVTEAYQELYGRPEDHY